MCACCKCCSLCVLLTTYTGKTCIDSALLFNGIGCDTFCTSVFSSDNSLNLFGFRSRFSNSRCRFLCRSALYQSHQVIMLFLNRRSSNRFNCWRRGYIVCGNSRCSQVGRDSRFGCFCNICGSRLNSSMDHGYNWGGHFYTCNLRLLFGFCYRYGSNVFSFAVCNKVNRFSGLRNNRCNNIGHGSLSDFNRFCYVGSNNRRHGRHIGLVSIRRIVFVNKVNNVLALDS